jgi:hypothetical protein
VLTFIDTMASEQNRKKAGKCWDCFDQTEDFNIDVFHVLNEIRTEAEQGRAEENKSKQSRGGSRGELTSRVVGEEEGRGRRRRGRRGAWPLSSGKKRGAAIVVREEEGRGRHRRGRRGVVALGRRRAATVVVVGCRPS